VPVVPVHLAGTHACLPRGARWPRRARVAVRFGAPLRFPPGTPPGVAAAELAAAVRALGDLPES
jgi:1-acyl-sn-glycerol-3-phosphate acyltransferase